MTDFVLSDTHRYWWPVTVEMPDPDNAGALLTFEFDIEFEPEDQDELLEAGETSVKARSAREIVEQEQARLLEVVCGWRKVVGPTGGAVPFTEENFRLALKQSWFRKGVYRAYAESLNGEAVRSGN